MPVIWKLKKWLAAEHDIYRPSELQALLAEKADVHLSIQAISTLMNSTPQALRLQTIQALCDALSCQLSDFCEVVPTMNAENQQQRKVVGTPPRSLYGSKTRRMKAQSIFPDPKDFTEES